MSDSDNGPGVNAGRGAPSGDFGGSPTDTDSLAVRLSDLARSLQDEASLDDTLQAIVNAAVDTVPGAQYAGISLIEARREVRTPAATDDLVRRVDRAQYEHREGPCLDALYEQRTVRLADMTTEQRWPQFADRAAELGIRSMLAIQLYVEQDNLGALNLQSCDTDAFDDESEQVGLLFAAHAGVAIAGAQKEQQLRQAMSVRDLIGQAKGILIERHKVTGDQAFGLLVRASQHSNTKLTDVARYLVDTGELGKR
ncbi:MAG TPA: GAF and ANTAR domain-containing protein [Micromonosporaceae bacterium]|nr:GAF and ANTAR domain-containing protein [Micromonosporaceae bacterium]